MQHAKRHDSGSTTSLVETKGVSARGNAMLRAPTTRLAAGRPRKRKPGASATHHSSSRRTAH